MPETEVSSRFKELEELLNSTKQRGAINYSELLLIEKAFLLLKLEWLGGSLAGNEKFGNSFFRDAILDFVRNQGEVEAAVLGRHFQDQISKRTLKRHLSQLVREGKLRRKVIGWNRSVYVLH